MADYYTGSTIRWVERLGKYQGLLNYKDANGKWKQKTFVLTPKKRESQALFEEKKAELNRRAIAAGQIEQTDVPRGKTVKDRVKDYLAVREKDLTLGKLEQSYYGRLVECAERYVYPEPIADVQYKSVTKSDIEDWCIGLQNKGLSNGTIRNPYSLLKLTYEWDMMTGTIGSTPFQFLKAPAKNSKPVNYADRECCARLFEELDKSWEKRRGDGNLLCFYLALYLGLRGEEACGLAWKDVHFRSRGKDGYIEITQAIARNRRKPYLKSTKTLSSYRKVFLHDDIERLLKEEREHQLDRYGEKSLNPNWFVTGDRDKFKNPDNVSSAFHMFAKRRNLIGTEGRLLTMHNLRDTFATIAVQEQMIDIKTLSVLLGHKDVAITLRLYSGYGDDKQRASGMAAMGMAMRGIRNHPKDYSRSARMRLKRAEVEGNRELQNRQNNTKSIPKHF